MPAWPGKADPAALPPVVEAVQRISAGGSDMMMKI